MAKQVTQHSYDPKSKKVVLTTYSGKKEKVGLIPLTPAPKTKFQKAARALWG